jgi:hypothetical protein
MRFERAAFKPVVLQQPVFAHMPRKRNATRLYPFRHPL